MQRHDLDAAELDAFLNQVRTRLSRLEAAFRDPALHVVAMIPADVPVRSRLAEGLARALQPRLRLAPPIKGK